MPQPGAPPAAWQGPKDNEVVDSLPRLTHRNPDTPAQLEVAATTLSFHLKELMYADLVSQERDGRHLIYRAAFEHMDDLLGYLTEHCCQGKPCAPTPATPSGKVTRKRACTTC